MQKFVVFSQQTTLEKLEKCIGRDILDPNVPMNKSINAVGLYVTGVDGRQLYLGNMPTKELYKVLTKGKN